MTSPANKETMPEVELEDFETLVERHSDFVYNVACRVMGNLEEAEDVALISLRKTKKARTLTQTGIDDMEIVDWTTSPDKEAVNSELRDKLQTGIDMLEPDLRAALVLRDVQDMSNTETAEILDISVSVLKSRLH
jgi:DNA-directed RNA polymerase specialized sigma24 family protein